MQVQLRRDWEGKKKGDLVEVSSEQFQWLSLRNRIEPIKKIESKVADVKREKKIDPELKTRKKKDFVGHKDIK